MSLAKEKFPASRSHTTSYYPSKHLESQEKDILLPLVTIYGCMPAEKQEEEQKNHQYPYAYEYDK
jgi:hypothetical protein